MDVCENLRLVNGFASNFGVHFTHFLPIQNYRSGSYAASASDTWTLGCAGGAVASLVPHAQVFRKTLVGKPTPSNYYYYY